MNQLTQHRRQFESFRMISGIFPDETQPRSCFGNNPIERVVQAFGNDEQLLTVSGIAEIGPVKAQLRQSMCERKLRYDKRGARTMINAFAKQRGRHGRPDNLRAYSCPFCTGWHLTKAVCEMF